MYITTNNCVQLATDHRTRQVPAVQQMVVYNQKWRIGSTIIFVYHHTYLEAFAKLDILF
jgi:hypothetical protein